MTTKDKKIIEDSEAAGIPIFVLTAKDRLSIKMLRIYVKLCTKFCLGNHTKGAVDRLDEFIDWQAENPNKVKYPD